MCIRWRVRRSLPPRRRCVRHTHTTDRNVSPVPLHEPTVRHARRHEHPATLQRAAEARAPQRLAERAAVRGHGLQMRAGAPVTAGRGFRHARQRVPVADGAPAPGRSGAALRHVIYDAVEVCERRGRQDAVQLRCVRAQNAAENRREESKRCVLKFGSAQPQQKTTQDVYKMESAGHSCSLTLAPTRTCQASFAESSTITGAFTRGSAARPKAQRHRSSTPDAPAFSAARTQERDRLGSMPAECDEASAQCTHEACARKHGVWNSTLHLEHPPHLPPKHPLAFCVAVIHEKPTSHQRLELPHAYRQEALDKVGVQHHCEPTSAAPDVLHGHATREHMQVTETG